MSLKDTAFNFSISFDPSITDEELDKISQDKRFQKSKDTKPFSQQLREGTVIMNYDCENGAYDEYIKKALAGEYDD